MGDGQYGAGLLYDEWVGHSSGDGSPLDSLCCSFCSLSATSSLHPVSFSHLVKAKRYATLSHQIMGPPRSLLVMGLTRGVWLCMRVWWVVWVLVGK